MMLFEEHGLFPSGEQFFFHFCIFFSCYFVFFLSITFHFSLYFSIRIMITFLFLSYIHNSTSLFSLIIHQQLLFLCLALHSPSISLTRFYHVTVFFIPSVTFFLDPYTLPYIAIKLVFIILQCKKFSSIFIQDHKCFFINVIIYKVFICKKLLFHTVFVPYRINV